MDDRVLRVAEVGKCLNTSKNRVYDLINAGLLPALKIGFLGVRQVAINEFLAKYEGKDLTNLSDIKDLKEVVEDEA